MQSDPKQAYAEIARLQLELAKAGNPDLAVANPTWKIVKAALHSGIVVLRSFSDDLKESYATLNKDIMNDPRVLAVEEFAEALAEPCPTAKEFLDDQPYGHPVAENRVFTFFQFGGYYGDPGGEGLDIGWDWNIKDGIVMLEFSTVDYVVEQFRP